ncbi:MAG: Bcr/CflA subfamily drug resistance transporter [Sphingomonas bacterium]|jgi:DHA1 family bicyclomycin/chloramphenicol resistance-like MFS transporter|nr:multidrug effflux MFS transporter [Sphingomonas bacterium]MDB5688685.1 Bcr/CflA subfamily drug resistance transporter [Sphingomonas bacterium]
MTSTSARAPSANHPGIGFREFVALVAALMAVNALGIDSMLPALPEIGHALGIVEENKRQWIIAAYMFGFGGAQLIYGPLADRYGRKPILLASMLMFAIMSVAAGFADSFGTMIAARVAQGMAAASSRVLSISIVRDCYAGRQMARVMSLTFIVFLAVPIIAPSLGQLIMLVMPWYGIFFFLAAFAGAVGLWALIRLPETLHPEDRQPVSPTAILAAAKLVLGNRYSLGYTLASTALFGSLLGFINSVQQIFTDIFHAPNKFPLVFAGVAGMMAVASATNARIVERLGTRRVSHTALLGFIGVSGLHAIVAITGYETIWTFAILQALMMACFGLAGSNFGSMAMEPLGHIAGTGSSIQGFISTVGGAAIGLVIGQSFDGTTVPVTAGFLILGLLALAAVLVTERGQLFRPHNPAAA